MKEYLNLLQDIMRNGEYKKPARKGLPGTKELFGKQLTLDLQKGFPLLTTKAMSFNIVKSELLWFLNGDTNISTLLEKDVHIWDAMAYEYQCTVDPEIAGLSLTEYVAGVKDGSLSGQCGPVYGHCWRNFGGSVDQLENVLSSLTYKPDSRRHIISAWNPCENAHDNGFQPGCPVMMQFSFRTDHDAKKNERFLDQMLVIRSSDAFLGLPYDIADYALLQHLIVAHLNWAAIGDTQARYTGLTKVGKLHIMFGSVHIYENYFEQVSLQLTMMDKPLPKLVLKPAERPMLRKDKRFKDNKDCTWKPEDINLVGYSAGPRIKAQINVGEQD